MKALGYDEAVNFLMHFGGASLYLAKTPKGRSEASELFGVEAMAKLAAHPALQLTARVPLAKPWLARVYARAAVTPSAALPEPGGRLT